MKLRWVAPLAATGAIAASAAWWRTHPSACPYGQRLWVQAPHPLITRPRLREALAPTRGERLLEIGPGTGYYTVAVAHWLGPDGTLEILDLQQKMVDHARRAARERGLANVLGEQGDARSLPYENDRFDGAFLVATLGEIPDQTLALRELARVIKPGGRLVVGELFGDPHWVRLGRLTERAAGAGLVFERRVGSPFGYFARFHARLERTGTE